MLKQFFINKFEMIIKTFLEGDETGLKWKWSIVKPGGARYGARSGVSCTFWGKKAYTFGGAADNETEEDLSAVFYNQLHSFDLHQFIWSESKYWQSFLF